MDNLTEDRSVVDIDDGVTFDLILSFMLGQIIYHATEHRSQTRTMLPTHEIEPPELSMWAWRKSEEGQDLLRRLGPADSIQA